MDVLQLKGEAGFLGFGAKSRAWGVGTVGISFAFTLFATRSVGSITATPTTILLTARTIKTSLAAV